MTAFFSTNNMVHTAGQMPKYVLDSLDHFIALTNTSTVSKPAFASSEFVSRAETTALSILVNFSEARSFVDRTVSRETSLARSRLIFVDCINAWQS
ncbi:hypothetical protein ACHAWO_002580 [Cyclotella atomus]|uniref:Uncharacterized protein n=1 Tax=Cyclotella atomus TaxID=382360 RepID=A0ABD3Q0P2_9STRA